MQIAQNKFELTEKFHYHPESKRHKKVISFKKQKKNVDQQFTNNSASHSPRQRTSDMEKKETCKCMCVCVVLGFQTYTIAEMENYIRDSVTRCAGFKINITLKNSLLSFYELLSLQKRTFIISRRKEVCWEHKV